MPNYSYICDNCEHNFEIIQDYHDRPKRKCKKCGRWKLRRIIYPPHIYSYNEPETIGNLAKRNTEKFGKYELEDKKREIEKSRRPSPLGKSKYKPWWRKGDIDTSLAKMTKKQKTKYIKTGKK